MIGVIAVAVVAASVLAAAGPQIITPQRPKPEKLCPITFHLDPTTSLQRRFARDVEETNAKLAQTLVDLRNNLMPTKDSVRVDLRAACGERFTGTYLANPVLWDESGKEHHGWDGPDGILAYLEPIVRTATYIHPQNVSVYMEYVPLTERTHENLAKKLEAEMKRRQVTKLWFDPGTIDFLATIRTVLAYAPYDDPMEIGNESPTPHQNLCDPIY